jgi:hypothetical protein
LRDADEEDDDEDEDEDEQESCMNDSKSFTPNC